MRVADSVDTLSRGEMVESELDRLITKRLETRVSEEQRRLEDAWAESVRAHNVHRDAELRAAWCSYHRDQAARHRATLEALITHHETEAARLMEPEPKGETA